MQELNQLQAAGVYDFVFFCLVWLSAAITGVLATFIGDRDHNRDSLYVFSVGALSGMVAYAFVGLIARNGGGTLGHEPMYIGIAIGIGALGKLNLRMVYFIVHGALKRLGFELDEEDAIEKTKSK